jgi:hypothetical protein
VNAVGYSYPWDYEGDPGAVERALAMGVDVVALAASYHACRSTSPLHPTRRVMEIPRSALYVPVREESWRGQRLIPNNPEWSSDDDLFNSARTELVDAGLAVDAWIVLTHHDELGRENPDLAVKNAFGDVYTYALCPQAPDVRQYCRTLVEEVVRAGQCRGVVLEACGPMGVDHASVHDKSEFARWSSATKELLSLCFCDHCRRDLEDLGVDVDELARRVRAGVNSGATSLEESLGDELRGQVVTFRSRSTGRFREEIVASVHSVQENATVTMHVSANQWATGSFPGSFDDESLSGVSTVVVNCWDDATGEWEMQRLRALVGDRRRVGAYVRLDRGWDDKTKIGETVSRYVKTGMDEVHLYHLGLVSQSGLDAGRRLIEASVAHIGEHRVRPGIPAGQPERLQ